MEVVNLHFASIDSTNTWAKRNAHTFAQDKITLVTADEQTEGRGRFHKTWNSPPLHNIYASFCFLVDENCECIGNIPQVLAISAAQMLEALGFYPKLKWPNDLLLSGKKVGGILCETASVSGKKCVVVGIGINVNMPIDILRKIDCPATSLFVESGRVFNISSVLFNLQKCFVHHLSKLLQEGFLPFLHMYKQRLVHVAGDPMRFHDHQFIWEGNFHSILSNGSLNLQLPSGLSKNFLSGEIVR